MPSKLSVNIGKLKLKNPVMAASGTFGYAREFQDLIDLSCIGAIVSKTITLKPRPGNPPPRVAETPSGMLNSIGLQNEGLDNFIEDKLPYLAGLNTRVIASIAAEGPGEIAAISSRLDKTAIDAIELNLSCPNIKGVKVSKRQGVKLVAQDAAVTHRFVKAARGSTGKTLIAKLSPNVTDIKEIARAAQSAGADAVSLVNTFYGMSIDIDTRMSRLGNVIGGLSGPAIKPIALKMVYDVYKAVDIPVIGMGGIMNAEDALEFIIAGASAVCVGTVNFVDPNTACEIVRGLEDYTRKHKLSGIKKLIGGLRV
ncbi:MAG: dihydroorotate dehydrogenase [Candidatus Omnitrophica bacterium]|nr:dihydroorotate dehydrogenase [Candidatus Omnitrophota bacterium]